MRAFFYVQHLLGIGHLKRAATLARALARAGHAATLATGGEPAPDMLAAAAAEGVSVVQLPPARAADLTFRTLLDESGRPADEAWRRRRREALLAAFRASGAQVLVIELFPFGRRQMRFELLPLLEAAAGPGAPRIACSVRDVLGGAKSAERQDEIVALVQARFDRVLVHGDPAVLPFERTFAAAARIADRLRYTGYVVDGAAPPPTEGDDPEAEVLVSAGGGAAGAPLIEAAIAARRRSALGARRWRILAGSHVAGADYARLARLAEAEGGGVVLERSRPDFGERLARCAVSVSQAGYNTLLETVQARARAVVVPFAGGHETEQGLRARSFAERGLVEVLEESALSPPALAAALDRAARRPRPARGVLDLGGAARSAELIAALAAGDAR